MKKMMIDYNQITSQFTDDLDKMQEQFVKRMEGAFRGDLSAVDLARLNAEIDFFEELNALGYNSKVTEMIGNYDEIVRLVHSEATRRGLTGIVGVAAQDLEILALNEEIFLLDKGRLYTQQFKNAIFRSIIGGETMGELLPTLRNIPLTDSQLTIGVSTGITRFQRTAVGRVYDEAPNQRFKLSDDPLDSKTRASCAAVIRHQPKEGWTRAEINAGQVTKIALEFLSETEYSPSERVFLQTNGYKWIEAGGWNCRHDWVPTGEFKGKGIE